MSRKLLPLLMIALGIAGFLLLKATRPEPAEVSATERSWLVQVQKVNRHETNICFVSGDSHVSGEILKDDGCDVSIPNEESAERTGQAPQ